MGPATQYPAAVSHSLEKLRADPVLATARRLQERISARFPDRGIYRVASELVDLIEEVKASPVTSHSRLRMVRFWSRVVMLAVVAATALLIVLAIKDSVMDGPDRSIDWLPLIESGINDLVFAAIAVWFLWSVPERLQRQEALRLLFRIRSLAHIVDMHHLTKDPERLRSTFRPTGKSAAPLNLDADELEHYLDYCSEMLSLVAKTAALCAEESQDAVVLDTVSTVETLTVGMSREIWQKISILNEARRA